MSEDLDNLIGLVGIQHHTLSKKEPKNQLLKYFTSEGKNLEPVKKEAKSLFEKYSADNWQEVLAAYHKDLKRANKREPAAAGL